MLEETTETVKIAALITGFIYVIRMYLQTRKRYPAISYEENSQENTDTWRWRKPDPQLQLQLQENAKSSHLILPSEMLGTEKVMVVLGYIGLLMMVWMTITVFFQRDNLGWPDFIILLIFYALLILLLHVGKRVSRIILYPDHLELELAYGFFFKQTKRFRHSPKLKITGEKESFYELTIDHKHPNFKLYFKRNWLFSKRYHLSCNYSQGSWLLEGLQHWLKHNLNKN